MPKQRWVVHTRVLTPPSLLGVTEPFVQWRYYRWRWMARLMAALSDGVAPMSPILTFSRSRILGRITLRDSSLT